MPSILVRCLRGINKMIWIDLFFDPLPLTSTNNLLYHDKLLFTPWIMKTQQKGIDLCQSLIWLQKKPKAILVLKI